MDDEYESLFVTSEEEGMRLDKLLPLKFPGYSRTYFQHLLDIGCVLLNGEPTKKRIILEEGDEIEICFQITPEISLEKENIPLDILYEDEYLLAVNKPAGMVVHPAPGHWSSTFVNALLAHCDNIEAVADPLRPGIVHRLDKDTTGVLLAAKTLEAHQKLVDLFAKQQMKKLYLAICYGRPKNQVIQVPIGRHPVHRKQMAVLPDGREACTEIKLAACDEQMALVLAEPKTGRTHQIRVHLKHVGCPIIGDSLYGKKEEGVRQLLHAYRLLFQHPITQMPMHLIAPIPEDMKEWMQKFSHVGCKISL